MRMRQVHLDFHTSEKIPGIGSAFSKEQFQSALKAGHVDSITVFSKCHHGWAYHPSTANRMHPNLTFDLLGAQLEACREIGVNAPVYLSAGFDEKEVLDHPEWLNVNPDGVETATFSKPHYHLMCYNTPYLDKLCAQVEEVMERYHPCGVFLDISAPRRCVCASCVKSMLRLGLNPDDPADIARHGEMVYAEYCRRIEKSVRKYSDTATIFHNAGHITHGRRDIVDFDTHLELESLPTGGWGYDHFPMSAAYVRTLGKEFLGMTGKFHTSWGEFGGFKHPNALIYETGLSLAQGAGCSIGDQLHPSGEMNMSTYRLIGAAYEQVEKKEKWVRGAVNYADIAVLSCEAYMQDGRSGAGNDANVGASRILLEEKQLFNIIDQQSDFAPYKLLILPDRIRVDEALRARLEAYLAQGGKVLLTGESGVAVDKDEFALDVGARYVGKSAYTATYMIPEYECVNGRTSYVMYEQSYDIDNVTGTVFAERNNPYFNRQPFFFSSHRHTPNNPEDVQPAAVINGNIAYIGWQVFRDYAMVGELHVKELVAYAINQLLGDERRVRVTLPDRGVVTVAHQEGRDIVHLLFAHTTKRGKNVEVIEDAVTLPNVQVALRTDKKPSKVTLVPQMQPIDFTYEDGRVRFTVPEVTLHQMVCVEE